MPIFCLQNFFLIQMLNPSEKLDTTSTLNLYYTALFVIIAWHYLAKMSK